MVTPRADAESFASLFEQSADATRPTRRYRTGERIEVTIVAVAREAVFADLGGKQEGVFERVELCDAEGKLRVEVGSKVAAVVGNIDSGTGQVRLSPTMIRGAEADVGVTTTAAPPGGGAGAVLVEGARVKGKVTGIERYGVFVQIHGTNGRSGRGLVPTPETGTPRGADLKKHFVVGQDVEAKILSIDEEGKIRLSFAALGADDERGMFEAYKAGQSDRPPAGAPDAKEAAAARKDKKPEPRGFGTLADLLSKAGAKAEPAKAPAKAAPAKAAPAVRKMAGPKDGARKR
jgi:small subunit ribosomal protein S1